MRLERRERCRAADVTDPRAGLDSLGDLRDRAVGDAEQDDVGRRAVEAYATLGEPRAHRRADAAARANDVMLRSSSCSSSVAGYRAP